MGTKKNPYKKNSKEYFHVKDFNSMQYFVIFYYSIELHRHLAFKNTKTIALHYSKHLKFSFSHLKFKMAGGIQHKITHHTANGTVRDKLEGLSRMKFIRI